MGDKVDDKTIDYLISLSIISIIGISISIILLINNKLKIINGTGFIDNDDSYKINLYNRILLTIVFIAFLIINYNIYIKAKEKGYDLTSYKLQIFSSLLIVISTLVSLYVAYNYQNNSTLENPET